MTDKIYGECVPIPLDIVDKLTDYIFNSAVIMKQNHPEILNRWECDRIEALAHYFQFFQKGDTKAR